MKLDELQAFELMAKTKLEEYNLTHLCTYNVTDLGERILIRQRGDPKTRNGLPFYRFGIYIGGR